MFYGLPTSGNVGFLNQLEGVIFIFLKQQIAEPHPRHQYLERLSITFDVHKSPLPLRTKWGEGGRFSL